MGLLGVLKALGRLLGTFPGMTTLVVGSVLLDTLYETSVPLLLGWLVDHAILPGRADLFLVPAVFLVGGWMASATNQVGRDWLLARLSSRVQIKTRESLGHWLQNLPFQRLERVDPPAWVSAQTSDLVQVENLVMNVLPPFLFGVFYLLLGIAAMVVSYPALGSLVLLGLPLTLVGPWLLARSLGKGGKELQGAEAEVVAASVELREVQPLIRSFDLAEAFQASLHSKLRGLGPKILRFGFSSNLARRLPNLAIHLIQLVFLIVGVAWALDGKLGVGTLLGFNMLFGNVLTAVLDIASCFSPLLRAGPSLERLASMTVPVTPRTPEGTPARPGALAHELRFQGVSFRYGPELPGVSNLSFSLPQGSRTAVVGPSGAGKSTLLALLLGWYHPEEGKLLWDGTDTADLDRSAYLQRLGVVFQNNPVFPLTIRENVALGVTNPLETQVWEALEAAGLASWVRELPKGLDTLGGPFLSGGQRQRLALARALFRSPDLLLLDEATSALDPYHEALVNDTLRRLAGKTTVVHITHRLPGIVDYDQILVLNQGRVAEVGTHAELQALPGGLYASLWRRQSGVKVTSETEARVTASGLRALPLFARSQDDTLEKLAPSFLAETVPAGTEIIRQGQPGTRFFLLARGRVEISRGGQRVATLADGDVFGEMSLLDSAPTSATVTALQETLLLALEKSTFLAFLAQDAELRRAVTEISEARRRQNAQRQR